jgi:hypothetical protein
MRCGEEHTTIGGFSLQTLRICLLSAKARSLILAAGYIFRNASQGMVITIYTAKKIAPSTKPKSQNSLPLI